MNCLDEKIQPRQHGGDVWALTRKYGIPLEKIVDFSAPINFLGPSPRAIEAVKRFAELIKFYPDQNPSDLKKDLCDYVGRINPENVVLGNGSMELIYRFAETLIRGTEALIPVPSFTEYERVSLLVSAKPKLVDMLPEFTLNVDVIKGLINSNKNTRLLFICNPHSPSGRLFNRSLILDLVEFCLERGVYVVLDENYIDFVEPVEKYTLAHYVDKYENIFVVRSFSKFFGMPGIRIGYGIGCRKIVQKLEVAKQPWCINSLAIVAAREALKDSEYIKKTKVQIREERKKLADLLNGTGVLRVYPSETNFLLVKILKDGFTARDLKERLEERGILIRDCGDFHGLNESYFRVTVRCLEENLMLVNMIKGLLLNGKSQKISA